MYAIARTQVPIFNRSSLIEAFFNKEGKVALDPLGLIRSLEMIALEGSVFFIKRVVPGSDIKMYEVETSEYRAEEPLYIPADFVKLTSFCPPERYRKTPSATYILDEITSYVGARYIWGGNYRKGVTKILEYIPKELLLGVNEDHLNKMMMKGVDCSGLMYEVSQGAVPRNSSWYLNIGEPISCEGLSIEKIATLLKPLDALIWPGHILFVLSEYMTIEARAHRNSVFVTHLFDRLEQIENTEKRKALNHHHHSEYQNSGYVVRRWHQDML